MRSRLFAIDGTGPAINSEYENQMQNSFVNQLYSDYKGEGLCMYYRGPSLPGTECPSIMTRCLNDIRDAIKDGYVVHLTGYSRGGGIAIALAKQIRRELPNVRIPVIALFDAVDREVGLGNLQTIPGNVDCVFHAMRDQIVRSRVYFGNCATSAEAPCQLNKLTFVTTHGGMGGVPLGDSTELSAELDEKVIAISPAMEQHQSDLVHRWMWTNLRKKGWVN